jgi:aldehyde dehydrogenase (NAD+)
VPAPKRGEILFRFGALVAEAKDELAQLMSREMGKVLAEAGGDVQEAVDMSYYMAGEGRRLFGHTTPSELPDKFQMSVRQPIGVVGVITPWNFPIAIPSWKIVPALVCGNTVVFKPANDTPMLAQRFVELLVEAGVPAGVVNLVHGFGREVGDRIVRHPDVRVVTLTGSRETGVAVLEAAAEGLKHVHLELGGKNGIIVMDDADLELAVDGIVWSAFGTSGQRCTAASRVIVHRSVYDELRSRLVARVENLRLGPGWESETDVGPVINAAALEKIHSYTEIGKDEGATLLTGGEIADDDGLDAGYFYRPTIFADVDGGMRIAQEEIFGPTTALIPVDDFDEAVRVANGIRYGLSSSIFTADVNCAFRAMRDLEAGITYVNAGTIGAEVHLPFGGTKDTGNGHREAGQAALDVFTEWKSIYVDYSGKLQRAQIDTE